MSPMKKRPEPEPRVRLAVLPTLGALIAEVWSPSSYGITKHADWKALLAGYHWDGVKRLIVHDPAAAEASGLADKYRRALDA